ncbi:MAG: valine--tRNA ligase [Clostridia bacterium]|nr:valine--tRNA ligase [Clostridia bacterium]
MEKTFNPQNFEKKIYKNWLEKNYFYAKINKTKQPFTIIMPPPNITSNLHIGHAYGMTLMDSITRFKRMQGFVSLLLPGCDHAALATEVKVIARLKSQGIEKEDIGRTEFLKKMYEWYEEFGNIITEQMKLLGLSCDWSRYAFTLDEPRSKAVRAAFVKLYNKGLIYKGKRITNWCIECKTALSDIEVEYEENNGNLYYIKYKIENSDKYLTVATTRPETLLGDVALAVNPKDKRYKHLVGQNVILPVVNKLIPIVADSYVDSKFGTGVVKITPAHDPNDFEVGIRHNLEQINVIDDDGTMNQNALQYAGLDRQDCRKQLISDLEKSNLLEKVEKYKNSVGCCQRCHQVVEPKISTQWYVKMKDLAIEAVEVVKTKKIKFIPQKFEKIYLHWMQNIKDWCISRQIWSGHRIPVFYCKDCDEVIVSETDPTQCTKCGSKNIYQDEDSLDTWFSSALWPFSTLGWPEITEDFKYFFPTNLMITAYDIIFFWIARMIFSSLEYTSEIPFENVLIHGLIRDSQGRKMSKSLGNGIDPVEIINNYGADSLRFASCHGVGVGQDSRLGEEKIKSISAFLNKIWNASRYVLDNTEKIKFTKLNLDEINLTSSDKWILSELNKTIKNVTKLYEKYDLGVVCMEMYEFVWTKFCDWYIEESKVKLYEGNPAEKNEVVNVLLFVLENILKLLHPIVPFITEEIYLSMPNHNNSIMLESFPTYNKKLDFPADHKAMLAIMDIIKKVRNLRADMNIPDNKKTDLYVLPLANIKQIANNLFVIKKLAHGKNAFLINDESKIDFKNTFTINEVVKVIIPNDHLIDKEKEISRLENELRKINADIEKSETLLNNSGFVSKAPAQRVNAERELLAKLTNRLDNISNSLKLLGEV